MGHPVAILSKAYVQTLDTSEEAMVDTTGTREYGMPGEVSSVTKKVIKRRQYYDCSFKLGVILIYQEKRKYWTKDNNF